MEYLTLKNSNLRVSRLCVGGCPMGGYGWGQTRETELMAAVHAALDAGVNFFDTADVYGLGQSEQTLGRALAGRRHRAVIATKCGVRVENGRTFYDNSPAWLVSACEASLRRLQTDYIDLYQIHYRDETPMEAVVEALETLRDQGKIRYFGLSNVGKSQLSELLPYRRRFASLQLEYSLARREREGDLLALAEGLDLTPMTWGSLGQGVLTGKYGPDAAFGGDDRRSRATYVNFRGEKLERNLRIVEKLREIALQRGRTPAETAVRFILDKLPGSVAICGVKRPSQLLTGALGWQLTAAELAALEEISER